MVTNIKRETNIMKEELVKIPHRFLQDCDECDCEVPEPIKTTKTHHYISTRRDELMNELISRAFYYSNPADFDKYYFGLVSSARATLKALKKANVLTEDESNLI